MCDLAVGYGGPLSEFYSLGTGDGEREHLRLMTSFANFQEAKVERE